MKKRINRIFKLDRYYHKNNYYLLLMLKSHSYEGLITINNKLILPPQYYCIDFLNENEITTIYNKKKLIAFIQIKNNNVEFLTSFIYKHIYKIYLNNNYFYKTINIDDLFGIAYQNMNVILNNYYECKGPDKDYNLFIKKYENDMDWTIINLNEIGKKIDYLV